MKLILQSRTLLFSQAQKEPVFYYSLCVPQNDNFFKMLLFYVNLKLYSVRLILVCIVYFK